MNLSLITLLAFAAFASAHEITIAWDSSENARCYLVYEQIGPQRVTLAQTTKTQAKINLTTGPHAIYVVAKNDQGVSDPSIPVYIISLHHP